MGVVSAYQETFFQTFDGTDSHYKIWRSAFPKAVIQIAHGMAEHTERYRDFAEYMVDNGYSIYANDHRGHGKTVESKSDLGFFAETDGWERVVADMYQLTGIIRQTEGETPIVLLGHSMGSLLARTYIQRHGQAVDGVIISGTSGSQGILGELGSFIAQLEITRLGIRGRSKLMNRLMFGSFNSKIRPKITDFDWLSRDEAVVDRYINDQLCGWIGTTVFYRDILAGVKQANRMDLLRETSKKLPILIFSGDDDPVGNYGKGVKQVFERMAAIGFQDMTCKLYRAGRHEMLHELNRHEVYCDLAMWLDARFK